MRRDFRQVDVFGRDPCTGNPVAVVLDAEGLGDEAMQRFAAWTDLSETTFVLPPTTPAADYRVRIFTPDTELPFAGHPTLGTARAWLDAWGEPATPGTVVQECAAGLVPVRIEPDRLAFAAPPRVRSGAVAPETVAALADIVGIPREQVVEAEWLDNGPGWIGLLLADHRAVLDLRPDASGHPGPWYIGVIGPHGQGSETAFEVRAFFTEGTGPLREDPVTGSLNAAAAQWLIGSGRATAPYIAAQGGAMGRRGRVHIDAAGDDLWVGGRAEVVVTGVVTL
jgi:PhzF family phenazine biosynthesis protein